MGVKSSVAAILSIISLPWQCRPQKVTQHGQTDGCEQDACDESHQHVHGSPNLSDAIASK